MNDKDKQAEELFKGVDDSLSITTGAVDLSDRDDVEGFVARMNPVPPTPKPTDSDDK